MAFDGQETAICTPHPNVRITIGAGWQGGEKLQIGKGMNRDRSGSGRERDTTKIAVGLNESPTRIQGDLMFESQVWKRESSESNATHFRDVGRAFHFLERSERPRSVTNLLALHQGSRLLEQGGIELSARVEFCAFGASASLDFLLTCFSCLLEQERFPLLNSLSGSSSPIRTERHDNCDTHHNAGCPGQALCYRGSLFQPTDSTHALAALQQCQIGLHQLRTLVAPRFVSLARFENDLMKFNRFIACVVGEPFFWNLGKAIGRISSGSLVKTHAQRKQIGPR
jgi:hypothetical protein